MKTCLCCNTLADNAQPTCLACGEASFADSGELDPSEPKPEGGAKKSGGKKPKPEGGAK